MTNYYEHIEGYKKNELNEELKREFEAAMNKDQDLKKAVENHDIVEEALELLLEEDIRGELQKIHEEGKKKKRVGVIHLYPILRACAAIGLLLITSYAGMTYFAQQRYQHNSIIERHYMPMTAA